METRTPSGHTLWSIGRKFYSSILGIRILNEPIVYKPEGTLSIFYRCGIDCLIMGNYIVEKTEQDYKGSPILDKH